MPTLAHFPAQASPTARTLLAAGALPQFPIINQLNDPEQSGQPDPNGSDDCWAVAVADAVAFLTGGSAANGDDGGDLNVYTYGAGHTGGGDAWDPKCLEWIAAHGCHLDDTQWANDSNVGDVLAYTRQQIDQGHPVVMTIPSQWGIEGRDNASGYHAVDVIGYYGDNWTIMNPWGGVFETYDTAWMESRCVNAGGMGREGPMVPNGWTDDGTTLRAPNGVPVVLGFRQWVLGHAWDPVNLPMRAQYHNASIEPGNAAIGEGDRQDFRMESLGYTVSRGVYEVWTGQDILALEAEVASLQARLTAASQPSAPAPAPVDPTVAAKAAKFDQMKAIADQAA